MFDNDRNFKQVYLNSLYHQCAYLSHFLEYHILANHLLKNGKALLFGGYLFGHNEWIERGGMILNHEIVEQVLADGGHFERSPMYHSIVVEDVLDLINLISASGKESNQLKINRLKSVARKMLNWLNVMSHPDQDIPLFGDSAFGIAMTLGQLSLYYQNVCQESINVKPSSGIKSLGSSGYYTFRSSDQFLVIDGGDLGVDYQPGHAHCDLFSYEYSYGKKRFIVDSGPGEYLNTPLRQRARSIYSHNCVVVNGMEQSEIWQTFRMGKRVRPLYKDICKENDHYVFSGSYKNNLSQLLSYVHKRDLRFVDNKFFIVRDSIEAKRTNSIESLIHLHSDCQIELNTDIIKISQEKDTVYVLFNSNHLTVKIENWNYVPEFGVLKNSKMILFEPKVLIPGTILYLISPQPYYEHARRYFSTYYSDTDRIN